MSKTENPSPETNLNGSELGKDVAGHAEIVEHVRKYGTKEGDPRRLYTQSQLELAMRLSAHRRPSPETNADGTP